MLIQQTAEYFDQMEESLRDKLKIFDHIKGSRVLDCGCGSGALLDALIGNGFDAKGIDSSLLALNHVTGNNVKIKDKIIHGDITDLHSYFNTCDFDTIIFSSVLHEVYSYYDMDTLWKVLRNAYHLLPKGGRIIIRDGVMPISNSKRVIRFESLNDVMFLHEYRRRCGREFLYTMLDSKTCVMSEQDAMEFLYTYTWGWESFSREVKETYGVFSMNIYRYAIEKKLFNSKVVHAESYLQKGYADNLKDKIDYYDDAMNECELPHSNMILVVEKG